MFIYLLGLISVMEMALSAIPLHRRAQVGLEGKCLEGVCLPVWRVSLLSTGTPVGSGEGTGQAVNPPSTEHRNTGLNRFMSDI